MTNWSIDFAPLLPLPIYWIGNAIALGLVAILFARRTRGAAFRALALGALMVALANPTLREEERENLVHRDCGP